jgi:hypothetical protein
LRTTSTQSTHYTRLIRLGILFSTFHQNHGIVLFTARFADCEFRFHPSVRVLFSVAVIFTICIVLLSDTTTTTSILDEDSSSGESSWRLGHVWEFGFLGMQAQRLADASVVHASSVWKLLGSSKEEMVEKGPPPSDGCESTVMLIHYCEKGNLKSRCNYNGYARSEHQQEESFLLED